MTKRTRTMLVTLAALVLLAGAACGDDDGDAGDDGGATAATDQVSDTDDTGDAEAMDDSDDGADDGADAPPTGGGGGGELTFGDETIAFDRALCFLEEQPVAGSEGTILLTAQGHGTNAAGEQVIVDFTRYDEESMFTGDDISVDIGDPRSDDFQGYGASLDLGGVNRDGNVLSATDVMFVGDMGDEVVGSFRIEC